MWTDGSAWRSVGECPEPSIACQVARIADSMSGFDWNAFWATLLATIVGAVVAAFIGLYVARIEKPQPYFRIDSTVPDEWETFDRKAVVRVAVSNIGDGAAYDLSFTVSGGLSAEETVRAARLESGASLSTWATLKMTGRQTMHPVTMAMIDGRKVYWPDHGLHASVKWHQPRRRRARLLTLPVTNPFAQTKREHAAEV